MDDTSGQAPRTRASARVESTYLAPRSALGKFTLVLLAVSLLAPLAGAANKACPEPVPAGMIQSNTIGQCKHHGAGKSQSSNGSASSIACTGTKFAFKGQANHYPEGGCYTIPQGFKISNTSNANPTLVMCEPVSNKQFKKTGDGGNCSNCGNNKVCSYKSETTCSPGKYYNTATGKSACQTCPYGWQCPGNGTAPSKCPKGQTSKSDHTGCQACPAGMFCATGRHDDQQQCPDGTYSTGSQTYCTMCPAGKHCNNKQTAGVTCGAGKYSLGGAKACSNCPAGFQCSNKSKPVPCQAGEYSTGSKDTCDKCPANKECRSTQLSTQNTCATTRYAEDSKGTNRCGLCLAGYKCNGSSPKVACTGTNWSLHGKSSCTSINNGEQVWRPSWAGNNLKPLECNVGYYSTSGTSRKCAECPALKKCTGTTAVANCNGTELCPTQTVGTPLACPNNIDCTHTTFKQCPVGQYKTNSSGGCAACPSGKTCHGRHSTHVSTTRGAFPANLNYYSPSGQTAQFICPGGYACSASSYGTAVACLTGYYSGEGDFECHKCRKPYACPQPEMPEEGRISCRNVRGYYQDADAQTECKMCPAGYKCPYGTDDKVQCATQWYSISAQEFCRPCPPGHYCPNKDKPKVWPCPFGYWSAGKQAICTVCAAGKSCNFIKETPCPAHMWSNKGDQYCHYNPVGKKSVYGANAAGSAAAAYSGAGKVIFIACDNGQYSLYGRGECKDCPKGHMCSIPELEPEQCAPGTYQNDPKKVSCKTCASGHWSLFGQWECYKCPEGHKCTTKARPPVKCPHGKFSAAGASTCLASAVANYELKSGSTQNNPAENKCQLGIECKTGGIGAAGMKKCSGGKYSIVRGGTCNLTCPVGYYCPPGYPGKLLCPPGFFCLAGKEYPTPIVEKFFGRKWGAETATDGRVGCPAGYTCPAGTTVPVICAPGQVCGANSGTSSAVVKCPKNKFSGAGPITTLSDCINCWPGHYCEEGDMWPQVAWIGKANHLPAKGDRALLTKIKDGQWSPWITASVLETGLWCPPGYWCKGWTPKYPIWWADKTKANIANWDPVGPTGHDINPCPTGKYSDKVGEAADNCVICPKGWACTIGTNALTNPKKKCKPGHFCVDGSVKDTNAKCPAGTFSNVWGLESNAGCLPCPAGKFCLEGSTAPSGVCPKGHYCKIGTTSATGGIKCPAGTYANAAVTGMKTEAECIICPVGQYCAAVAGAFLQVPIDCPIGTYSSFVGLTHLSGGARSCKDCPKGYKCTKKKQITPEQCQKGYYQDTVKQTTCKECPIGSFCRFEATTVLETCEAGYLCPNKKLTERPYHLHATYSCPRGSYCLGGANAAVKCPVGTYQPKYGAKASSACLKTPAGFYTAAVGSIEFYKFKCPPSYWCLESTGNILTTVGRSCPAKKFRSQTQGRSAADCGDCPSGFYCPEGTAQPKKCPKGFYCPAGVASGTPCPTGTFGTAEGLATKEQCQTCYGGRYCEAQGLVAVEGVCDKRFYCVDGSNVPSPRSAFVGIAGGECPQGGFCPVGSKFPRPCKPGRYKGPIPGTQTFVSGWQESECYDCPPGEFCDGSPDLTRTDIANNLVVQNLPKALPTGSCTAGFYCTGKSTQPEQFICQQGEWSATKSSGCNQADKGFFVPKEKSATQTPCTAGYYCPWSSTETIEPYKRSDPKVPRGNYEPIICPKGYYCPEGSQNYLPYPAVTAGVWAAYKSPSKALTGTPTPPGKCPIGKYSTLEGLRMVSQCFPCKEGYYCATAGIDKPDGLCRSGYYCILGAKQENPNTKTDTSTEKFGPCPRYHYCQRIGAYTRAPAVACSNCFGPGYGTPCPPGTNRVPFKGTQKSDCTPVTQTNYANTVTGHGDSTYTPKTGTTVIASTGMTIYSNVHGANPHQQMGKCQIGYYCETGSKWPTDKVKHCKKGEYCPAGSFKVTACVPGQYQPNPLQGKCFPCPAGYKCPDAAAASTTLTGKKCGKGYYCVASTSTATGAKCPKGTFNAYEGAFHLKMCIPSPAGFYQDLEAQDKIDVLKVCKAGYYCKYGAQKNNPDSSNAGQGYQIDTGGRCQKGYYCPAGSVTMIPCTPGYLCTADFLAKPNVNCPAGKYCSRGSKNTGSDQKECPKGFYCPLKSGEPTPCPAGTYNNSKNKTQLSDCKLVTAGKWSSKIASLVDGQDCHAGFTCPAGSTHNKVTICPKGFKCVTGSAAPVACSLGGATAYYQDEYGATACKPCPAGYICEPELAGTFASYTPNLTSDISIKKKRCTSHVEGPNYYCPANKKDITKCPKGTYNYFDKSFDPTDCWACPPGYYCPDTPANQFLKIVECTKGKYCNGIKGDASTHTPKDCEIGYYCPQGSATPIPCDNGSYCATKGLSAPTGLCDGGYTCGTKNWNPLNNGPLMASRAWGCINSDQPNVAYAGMQCVEGAKLAADPSNKCPKGNYCPKGSIVPVPCAIGTYLDTTGGINPSDCKQCPAGKSCLHRGQEAPGAPCKPGYFCPSGSSTDYNEECPVGHKCPAQSTAATPCSTGEYQPNTIQSSCKSCPQGYYCHKTGMQLPQICPKGWYCPANTKVYNVNDSLACPLGTFSDQEGIFQANQCQDCPYGKFCDAKGLVSGQQGKPCTILKKCYGGRNASNMVPCVSGEYCPAGTAVPGACPPGQYATNNSPMGTLNCTKCDVKKYCPEWGMTKASQKQCSDGYICKGGTVHPSVNDDVTVSLCPVGNTCKSDRAVVQVACVEGTYQNMKGQIACEQCLAGFQCPTKGLETPIPCPEGYYCPKGVHPSPKCPAGKYNSFKYAKSVADCQDCPPGKFCEAGTKSFTGFCDAGFVCTGGQATKTPTGVFDKSSYLKTKSGPCPTGHYCKRGSAFPEKCAPGTYQDEKQKDRCKDCPAGAYCGVAGMTSAGSPCADGYVCFGKARYAQPQDYITGRLCNAGSFCKLGFEAKCVPGKYTSIRGLSECLPCPPGYYCNDPLGTSEPKLCSTYNFCPQGSALPTNCPAGTYTESFMKGLEASHQCAPCPTGYFCPSGAYDSSNKCEAGYYCHSGASAKDMPVNLCPMGYYCVEGAKLPTECPAGKFSEKGAGSEAGCTLCTAGYYCVREVNIAYKVKCPAGHFCPEGEMYPRPCPKGTSNPWEKGDSSKSCKTCPAGTNCNRTGIARHENNLCPPGFYCPKKTFSPIACPAGTWRPNQGGTTDGPIKYTKVAGTGLKAGCYFCIPGYYCPKRATTIPEICRAGSYCKLGSIAHKNCPPGFYCPAGSPAPKPCPKGFYCAGRSERYFKCKNGTYCPEKSASEIPCPAGMYGSGRVDNFSVETGCRACGRGLYSTEAVLNSCLDCTPGYVCLGNTSSRYPSDKLKQRGYQCPTGYYCPKGSFQERPCLPGYYAKKEGTTAKDKCLPCKLNTYNDAFGQSGCKRCGPTSKSDGYATTCKCVGKNREFVKSLGACLCKRSFKTKNQGPNEDSVEDCENLPKKTCTPDQDVDATGQCIDKREQGPICEKQCPKGSGRLVEGTGMCQCDSITDPSQVCGAKCQKTSPTSKLQKNGLLLIKDPTSTAPPKEIDPSTIPGYYGDFKCKPTEGTTECSTFTLGMSEESGDFEFDYGTNKAVLDKAGMVDNTDKRKSTSFMSSFHRFMVDPKSLKGRRYLQAATNSKLQNPALCIKAGDVVFFNVVASKRSYPRYFKDSILNTNAKFDYGAFEDLKEMIEVKGVDVQTFSYAFREEGIYVFSNASSGTMTVIGVVKPSQVCTNVINGVGAAMITQQSLAELGIESQDNSVDPDWVFIGLSFFIINMMIYAFVGLVIWTYNLNQKRADVASTQGMVGHSGSIYYDKINQLLEDGKPTRCCGLFRKQKQQENRIDAEDLVENKKEYSMSYADLERLRQNLDSAQETLAQQLRDKEKRSRVRRQGPQFDEDGNEVEVHLPDDDEERLLTEFEELMDFVRENRKTIGYVADEEQDAKKAKDAENAGEEAQEEDNATRTQRTVMKMLGKQLQQEQDFANISAEAIRKQQEIAFGAQMSENEDAKNKLLDKYRDRLANGNLSADERAAILAEMEGKMAMINSMIEGEEQQQNSALADALARRRAKKEKLKNVINNLAAQKDSAIEKTEANRDEILRQEQADIAKIEKELDMERKAGSHQIEIEVENEKQKRLAAAEKRLNDFKKRSGGANDDKFADMLTEYGELVKKVESDLENEKGLQYSQLEERLAARRRQRKKDISEKAQDMEAHLNKNSVDSRQDLQEQLNQVESMLQPVKNEAERVNRITEGVQTSSAINQDAIVQRDTINLSQEGQNAQRQLQDMNKDNEIENIQAKIEKQNQVRQLEVEQQRELIKKRLERPDLDESERARIMKQLNQFEDNLKNQLQSENDSQAQKLKEALEKRRARKKKLGDKVSSEKQQIILDRYKQGTAGKVKVNADEDGTSEMAQKFITGFDSNEVVQVTENYIDKKTQQELIDLMNALFDERSRALRKYMFELLAQKAVDLEDLSQEFEPQKELLRSKRTKGLIDEDQFTREMERLNTEMAERKMDLDIEYSDKEKAVTEELEKIKLDAENEQQKILKDRQTQEKLVMFKKLMEKTGEENASVKAYLQKQIADSEKELDAFKRKADRDKQKKMDDMEADKEAQMQGLMNRQQRMFNWEDKMRKQEMQFMDQFEQQKNALKAKKLADQQKELLKDMNQKDVDVMLARHKKELEAIETALAAEQKRQMDQMKEQMKSRNAKLASEKALRQIKLAEIQKSKLKEAQAARLAQKGNVGNSEGTENDRERRIAHCVEKAEMLQKLIQKQNYSRPIYVRRHVMNMQKLNGAYGLNAMGDWGVSQENDSIESDITVDTQRDLLSMLTSAKNITYKLLLDHVDQTQNNYDAIRDKKGLSTKDQLATSGGAKGSGIGNLLDGLKSQKGDN